MSVSSPGRSVSGTVPVPAGAGFSPRQYRQFAFITLGAVAVFWIFRHLPTGTNLNHMDFRVQGGNSIEMCDPANPQFIPVVNVRSPVTMVLRTEGPAAAGREVRAAFTLQTASGKPVAPEDLAIAHTKKMHLLIADPTLTDYQHVHPLPTRTPGEWTFHFTPRFGGTYRIFADFTPVATGRGLYANTELAVAGASAPAAGRILSWTFEREGYRFQLQPGALPLRARQPIDLKFGVTRLDGGAVPMEPVMGAYAHLVAFDEGRSGFAHLHPMEIDLSQRPDALHPTLSFKLTIPAPGRYVIWAQVNLGGREMFAPFWFDVI
ncbi:MAG TPA: hypothetical protein VG838_01045 [Opitutaceae bacterium]|nr:hypothetical protein [Opitutaceae bacterium]